MLLTIDVGNTNMVFSLFSGEALAGSFRLTTVTGRTSDELGMDIWNQLSRLELKPEELEAVIISSVVPPVMAALTDALVRYLGKTPIVVDVDVDPGLPYGVVSNEHLGTDRSVACVAAIHKYGAPLILADMGTATTVDAISRQGVYMGGCITAGARISIEALFQKTALLPQVNLALPERVLSGTAVGQIQAGAVLGYIGAMERLITQAREELDEPEAVVVATGGLAPVIAAGTDLIDVVDGQLIPDGLRLLYQKYLREHT
ncbi:type III pantothenate kinase [Intestinimonas butyriciproducens]|uniref:Type III pantothenate kinase n=1 Tax=Candidatus Intestinimonas merdavium TaxID=2838622 RepID=A0A9D2CE10_9FIRM|nr:type III pantothenate kinase [Intestinimonas butyriciproducens]MBM6975140.1 type III pantothenate kinase [Intestinimonas butyriciproducens]HIY73527.1 type III pantothenate kinase [Candidatus Intestinimonas merdavium]